MSNKVSSKRITTNLLRKTTYNFPSKKLNNSQLSNVTMRNKKKDQIQENVKDKSQAKEEEKKIEEIVSRS